MSSAILEDMVKHPIDTTALNPAVIESAAGGNAGLNNSRLGKMLAGAKTINERTNERFGSVGTVEKTSVNEGRSVQTGGAGIDYALIKSIVNECIENKLNEMLGHGLLNEGTTLKGIGLSNGNIKLIDNKGNVYSAKLEYKGNTKDKK